MTDFKRIEKNSVTDALVEALEHAGEMESIVILYENKESAEASHGLVTNSECDLKTANYLVDCFKAWLLGSFRVKDD